jgi:glutamate-1-semialdehyde 2,1-aminomutase
LREDPGAVASGRDTTAPARSSERSRELNERLRRVVPGGAHTYAKGDDQFPEGCAPIMERGSGCRVWDVDGNEYIEYGMGLRAVTLGHGYPAVADAVASQLGHGTNFVRPSRLELEAAETFLGLVTRAEMVKFTKDGSTANNAAVRLARAATGRDRVAICADHPFFSTEDWFIGTTPMNAGIPKAVRDLTVTFRYDDLASVECLFEAYPGEIACVILEASRGDDPKDGFLHETQRLCRRHGAIFILDENITGFRWHLGGAQRLYGITPDLSTFGKALANGFAVSALVGRRELMELGGIRHDRERVFLLSTTHGGETHGLAAAIAAMRVYRREPVVAHLERQGTRLAAGVRDLAKGHGVERHVEVVGRPCNLSFATLGPDGAPSQAFRALFLQELIARGVLAPSFVLSYSHRDEDVDRTLEAVDGALAVYQRALEAGGVERFLDGPPTRVVFRRYC